MHYNPTAKWIPAAVWLGLLGARPQRDPGRLKLLRRRTMNSGRCRVQRSAARGPLNGVDINLDKIVTTRRLQLRMLGMRVGGCNRFGSRERAPNQRQPDQARRQRRKSESICGILVYSLGLPTAPTSTLDRLRSRARVPPVATRRESARAKRQARRNPMARLGARRRSRGRTPCFSYFCSLSSRCAGAS